MRRWWTASFPGVVTVLAVACVGLLARSFPTAAQQRPGGRHRGVDAGVHADGLDGGIADGSVPSSDGAAPGADAAPADAAHESERDRESWRVAPDLVNPFSHDYDEELHHDGQEAHDGEDDHARPVRPRSWYLVEDDLVDPWTRDHRRVRPEVVDHGGTEGAAQLGSPYGRRRPGSTAQERLAASSGVEAELLVGAATLAAGDARPRLDAELVWRLGTFLLGLDILVSGGAVSGLLLAPDGHVFHERSVYGREGALVSFGHRLTDGTLSMDVSLDAGVILSVLTSTDVLPFLRAVATGALRVARGVALTARVDVGTSFVAAGDFVAGGPGSFELGLSLGVRLGGD